MILQLLKGKGMVSGLFENKRDAISPHPAPLQAMIVMIQIIPVMKLSPNYNGWAYNYTLHQT
jgi:hypothetical protein